MSWTMMKEVRDARLAGQLPDIDFSEFAVLLLMADTCRGESRQASISMTELANLSGKTRSTMWRAVKKLSTLGYARKLNRGNQYQVSNYEVLPSARCTGATSTEGVHVASDEVHVAKTASARRTGATHPSIPDKNPDGSARPERRAAIDNCPDCDQYGRLDDLTDCPRHPNFRKAG
jgi:hypothetical protein